MMKWLVNSGWWLGNRHSPLRRGISFVFSLSSLVLITACTDYVSQIEDRYGEWNVGQVYVLAEESSSSVAFPMSSWSGGGVRVGLIGSITDSRDGQSYKTVTIGTQTWMAQNLNYETANSYCYSDTPSNCTKYGRLYTWAAAMDSVGSWSANGKGCGYGKTCSPTYPVRGVCPEGWHLPSYDEWNALFTTVGGFSTAGTKLKSTSGWYSSGNGTDAYSFSALPAGSRYNNGDYINEGYDAYFWSSTENNINDAFNMFLYYDYGSAHLNYYKHNGFSVRCVKDDVLKGISSSSVELKSSSSNNNVATSSSNGAKGSSSSVSRSSSSSFIWEPSSSSSSSESIFIPPSSSSVAVSPSLTDGGTCAPVYAIVESGEKVIWKYTVGGIVKTTDMLSAIFKWTTPGGSPESLEGKGIKYMSDSVTYATSGQHTATLILSTTKGSFNLTCEPVQVNPSSSSIAFPMSSSSSSITQKSSRSVALPVSSSSSVIPSSSSVSSPMSSWSGGGAGAIGSITDTRDGQTYKTVTIGMQTWMAQNLNYETANSYCYNDNASNCIKYGRLYTWSSAITACPTGWHLPTKAEFETLITAVGGQSIAGTKLKSTRGWNSGGNGTDDFSFSALPAGGRYYGGDYGYEGYRAEFWSSTKDGNSYAYYVNLYYGNDDAYLIGDSKGYGRSVRCVKD